MTRYCLILTQGHSNPHTAKTACSMIRYRSEEVAAVLDSDYAGKSTGEVLGVGDKPFVASIDEAPEANTLLIGIAPTGGKIPDAWRPVVLEAISRGMNVVSGLHDFFSEDEQFAAAAKSAGAALTDVRKNNFRTLATGNLPETPVRIHTVGHDCSVGKMVTAIEVANALSRLEHSAKFLATGQTGIMISGEGLPVDCIASDFVSGAAEALLHTAQNHEFALIEGQGSLVHPAYSGVTLGLLHGSQPHGMLLCYEVGREFITGHPTRRIPSIAQIKSIYETMANLVHRSRVIGIAMNSRKVTADEAEAERARIRNEFQLPVCDVFRHGADELAEAVLELGSELSNSK